MRWLFLIFTCAFILYAKPIIGNTVVFHPDEMYWIGSGQIIPLLYKRDTTNLFWNEYYGYANFNGAKLIYGVGLTIMGHTDYRPFWLPPATYYRFESFGGKPFPADHPLSPMVRDGRLISALFAAASVGLMFWYARATLGSTTGGVLSAAVFALHPIMLSVGTHAYADSMFSFFMMIFLIETHRFLTDGATKRIWPRFGLWGGLLAALASVKLNGLLFFVPALFAFGMKEKNKNRFLIFMIAFIFGFVMVFAILHPNFFFYPTRGPVQIITDRVRITRDHMIYFDAKEPGHVLWDIPSRVGSLYRQIFVWPWLLPVCIAGVWLTMRTKKKIMHFVAASALAILIGTLGIVVFDEARYYLPLLPFVSLLAGGSIVALYGRLHR